MNHDKKEDNRVHCAECGKIIEKEPVIATTSLNPKPYHKLCYNKKFRLDQKISSKLFLLQMTVTFITGMLIFILLAFYFQILKDDLQMLIGLIFCFTPFFGCVYLKFKATEIEQNIN